MSYTVQNDVIHTQYALSMYSVTTAMSAQYIGLFDSHTVWSVDGNIELVVANTLFL